MSNHQQGTSNGPPSAGMSMNQSTGQQSQSQGQNLSQQNLNQIVIEYLVKKGYTKTEQTLRQESSHVDKDGRPVPQRPDEQGFGKYSKAFCLMRDWAEGNLDAYKAECRRVIWPMFVYSYLELVVQDRGAEAEKFFTTYGPPLENVHADELRVLETVKLRQHVFDNDLTKLYRENKYRIPLNHHIFYGLMTFVEEKDTVADGGRTALFIFQTYCELRETTRGPLDQFSFDAIINNAKGKTIEDLDLQEGIEGAFTGVSNRDIMDNTTPLKLGQMAMEAELAEDVRAELEEEDRNNPPHPGKSSLVDVFDQQIKREEDADGPSRTEIPQVPSRARDVVMEVQKIKEYRDRFKIPGRRGGTGPGVSVCMWTFHNTMDSVNCIEFSDDSTLVACGTEESYIRVWHTTGEALTSKLPQHANEPPAGSRRLIGHSGPVYNVSFSPSIDTGDDDDNKISTKPKLLLSCSADGTIRLWSLELWIPLIVYKGHDGPVWNVKWGPHGHYFASCGWDKTVRVWSQDHISPHRLLVGHDSSVNQVAWHPNGAYAFSASDQVDKTVRMWSFVTGDCVRVFSGHTDMITSLECSPSGKILASADSTGTIILWDIAQGTLMKRCRGHQKGGIWSLSFSVESTVLVSGSGDGSVRVWDVKLPDGNPAGDGDAIPIPTTADLSRGANNTTAGSQAGATAASASGSKKKGKETTITPDQISAFPTKKTPVFKVKFTRMNLVLAAGLNQG